MEAGRFREDFYYRLCADRIETPSLRAQLQESPEDITNFVRFIATRLLPELPEEAGRLTDEVVSWVHEDLGPDYPWPGNIRELEQCVRSIMVRGSYRPTKRRSSPEESQVVKFLEAVKRGELTREELLTGYFSLVYSRSGSYRAAGRLLGIDWRTVKEVLDVELVRQFTAELE
jgi:transcriptional regulator with PAS, ATPase and Fis domain